MKLTLLVQSMDIGGMQRQLIELVRWLPALDVDAEVVLFYLRGGLLDELRNTGIPVRGLNKRSRYDVVGFGSSLVSQLRRSHPDVLYAWQPVPSVVASLAAPALKRPKVVWGVRQSAPDFRQYDRALRWSFAASRVMARSADLVICNSEAGRKHHVAAGYPADRSIVIPNGIDARRWYPDRALGVVWRRRWGVSSNEFLVGLPGRMDPMKGHGVLIQAVANLRSQGIHIRLAVIGPGAADCRDRIASLARDLALPDLIIEDAVADMLGVYNALDLAVLPSLWGEGFPNVVAEAMACGTPVVVSDVGDSAGVVGSAGSVVPPRDPAALAVAIRAIVQHSDRTALARAARARIEREFSLKAMATSTISAIAELL